MNYKTHAETQLRSVSFDKRLLPDITEISIPDADAQTKIEDFVKAVGNPYLFRVGDIGVHVVFSGTTGDSLQQRIGRLLTKSI